MIIPGQFIKRRKWWFGPPHQRRFDILTMMGRECIRLNPSYQRHITFAYTCYNQLHPHDDHITDLLRDRLHWLRIPQWITFKCCLLVYKSLHGLAPAFIAISYVKNSIIQRRSGLRSASREDLVIFRRPIPSSENVLLQWADLRPGSHYRSQ